MPNAAILAERLKSALEQEQQERRRFYEIVDENKHAEFINGKIVFNLPDTLAENKTVGNLMILLNSFVSKNNLGFVGQRTLVVSLTRNDCQPDICYFGDVKAKNLQKVVNIFPRRISSLKFCHRQPKSMTARRNFKIMRHTAFGNIGLLTRNTKRLNSIFCKTKNMNCF